MYISSRNKYFLNFIFLMLFIYWLNIPNFSHLALLMTIPLVSFRIIKFSRTNLLSLFLLFLFGAMYYYISFSHEIIIVNLKTIIIIFEIVYIYYLGILLGQRCENIYLGLAFPAMGMILFGNISIINYLFSSKQIFLNFRRVPTMWTGAFVNTPMLEVYIVIGICFITTLFTKINYKYKLFFVFISLISVISALSMRGRGGIFLGLLSIFISIIYLFIKKNYITKIYLVIIFCFLIIFLIYISVNLSDTLSSPDIIKEYLERGLESGRYSLWSQGLIGLFKHPIGGKLTEFNNGNFAHNFWLDVGWYTGLLPVFIIIIFQIINLKSFIYIKKFESFFFIIGIFVAVFGKMFLEPVMIGSVKFFLFSIYFLGYINGYTFSIKIGDFYDE